MRIFLVENHPDTLAYVQRHLVRAGHEVETAQTVAEAVSALSSSRADVLLADLGLPDGDGCTLLEMLGSARPTVAILMSGSGSAADLARSAAVGFQTHLVKPFLPEELDRALQRALASESAR